MTVMAEAFEQARFQQKFQKWVDSGKFTADQVEEARALYENPICRCAHSKDEHKKFGCGPKGGAFCRCKRFVPPKEDE